MPPGDLSQAPETLRRPAQGKPLTAPRQNRYKGRVSISKSSPLPSQVEGECPGCGKPCAWERLTNGMTKKHHGKACRQAARRARLRAIYKAGCDALAGKGEG